MFPKATLNSDHKFYFTEALTVLNGCQGLKRKGAIKNLVLRRVESKTSVKYLFSKVYEDLYSGLCYHG